MSTEVIKDESGVEAPVLEKKGTTVARRKQKAALQSHIAGVDTKPTDVLKWATEGREIYFGDQSDFVEISDAIYAELTPASKQRYQLAKSITNGENPIDSVMDSQRGWKKTYNTKPGSASGQLLVEGKDPKKDYFLARAEDTDFHANAEGFQVTRDPNVTVGGVKESCTYKTVGGQKKPEMVLMERPISFVAASQKKAKDARDRLTKVAQNDFVEKTAQNGVVGLTN